MNRFMTVLSTLSLATLTSGITNRGAGELIQGLPCVKRHNQLYCDHGGFNYPMTRIEQFIDDNKALMRRMYGAMVEEYVPPPPPMETPRQTPASTTFVRTVRNFGGSRFKREIGEGYLEDMLLDDFAYTDLDANFSDANILKRLAAEQKRREEVEEEHFKLHVGQIRRGKRQANFPGIDKNKDGDKLDACESRTEVTSPFWATNSDGHVRAIVNSKTFEQSVHQEICSTSRTLRCAGDCQCEQKYKWHRLLAYDPNDDCKGIFMDWFLFPSCCACRCARNPLRGTRT